MVALVPVAPFPDAILVEHVSTDRLVAVRDPSPPMDDDSPQPGHGWGNDSGGHQYPGLVIAWRGRNDGWDGYVALARDGSVLITWEQASPA